MHLLIADDHRLVLDALHCYMTRLDPEIEVTEAYDFPQARDRVLANQSIDLVLLDVNMPGMNGLQGLDAMRECCPDTPVVLLSGAADPALVREALRRGAAGFIPKDLSGKAMLRALELVMSGEIYVPAIVLSDGMTSPGNGACKKPGEEGPLDQLTRREGEVLSLLVEGQSNKQIAQALGLKDITVAFHLKGIFRKLGASNRTEAVIAAVRSGWSV